MLHLHFASDLLQGTSSRRNQGLYEKPMFKAKFRYVKIFMVPHEAGIVTAWCT